MRVFERAVEGIYRLKIPFDTVYTSVFLIERDGEYILMDCATTEGDVKNYILPALQKKGVFLNKIRYLVVSHHHEDHAGGLPFLIPCLKNAEVITEERTLFEGIFTYALSGHTRDCIGLLDLRSKTLISADAVQGYGVDKYRCTLHDEEGYLATLEKIRKDDRIENILFSHAYEPWRRDCAFGKEEIINCLRYSESYTKKENYMKAIVINKADQSLSYTDVPHPVLKAGEVLIETYAAALNRADLLQREGNYPPPPVVPSGLV